MCCSHKLLESECKTHQVQKNVKNLESSSSTIAGNVFSGDPGIKE